MNYLGDIIRIETTDGLQLEFPDPEMRLISYGQFGAPPTSWITSQGYKQIGATEIDYSISPRSIEVEFWHAPACNRQAYWDTRLSLHEIFQPNRGGPMTITLIQPGGQQRALIVRADPGFVFPPEPDNNWSIREVIDMIAFDPIWFDPDTTSTDYVMTGLTNTDLVFSITFPIVFGTSGLIFSTGLITYPGTWRTYPIFTLTGPYTSATITNVTTGAVLSMVVAIGEGDTRIIDLTPGAQRIVDGNGVSRYNELGANSNLIDLNIRPEPEVPGGIQTIQVVMLGGVMGQSSASIAYYNRYFAI